MNTVEANPLAPLDFLSKEELAYRQLRSAILTNVIAPGERMVIRDLADRFHVSTMPVRQALMRLEAERLVVRLPRGGMVAAPLSLQEVEEIYAMRVVLEGMAARFATRRANEADLAQLAELVDAMKEARSAGDIPRLIEINTRFHFFIYRTAGNERLFDSLSNLWDICYRYRHISYSDPSMPGETVGDHVRTLEAMRRGDVAAAEQSVADDMERTARLLAGRLSAMEVTAGAPV